MAQHHGTQAREKSDKVNSVLGVTEIKMFAFRFADANGNVSVAFALSFGKDQIDGGPGVYSVNPEDIERVVKLSPKFVADAVRAHMNTKPVDLAAAGSLDLQQFTPEG
jgi:hypothetical protein